MAGSVVVFIANYLFFVRTTLGQELDDAALVGGEQRPQGVVSEAWELLDVISVASLAAACAAIGVVALLRRRFALASRRPGRDRRRERRSPNSSSEWCWSGPT